MCARHYQRWRKHGDAEVNRQGLRPVRPPIERFTEKVEVSTGGCWLWTAGCFDTGYGAFRVGPKLWRAHVWAWEHYRGTRRRYPADHRLAARALPLDHVICQTRRCVNPDHLVQTTDRINVLRSNSLQARNFRKTACVHGHAYTPTNTGYDSRGSRFCRTCYPRKRSQGDS